MWHIINDCLKLRKLLKKRTFLDSCCSSSHSSSSDCCCSCCRFTVVVVVVVVVAAVVSTCMYNCVVCQSVSTGQATVNQAMVLCGSTQHRDMMVCRSSSAPTLLSRSSLNAVMTYLLTYKCSCPLTSVTSSPSLTKLALNSTSGRLPYAYVTIIVNFCCLLTFTNDYDVVFSLHSGKALPEDPLSWALPRQQLLWRPTTTNSR